MTPYSRGYAAGLKAAAEVCKSYAKGRNAIAADPNERRRIRNSATTLALAAEYCANEILSLPIVGEATDPDLVIADALSTAKHALSEAKAEAERAQSLFAASVRDAERHYAEAERLREALEKVERWQFPPTGKFWESGTPVSYGAAYGSNGERDYMRNVARAALAATRKEEGNG